MFFFFAEKVSTEQTTHKQKQKKTIMETGDKND